MRTSMPRALCSSGLPCVPGTRIMSPKAVKITSGSLRDGKAVVNSAHGQNANGAARAVNQLNILREKIFQAESINRVGVAAANFHDAVMTIGIGETANFFRGLGNYLGFAKLVDKFHDRSSAGNVPVRCFKTLLRSRHFQGRSPELPASQLHSLRAL